MKALSIRQPWASLIIYGIPLLESVSCEDGVSTRLEDIGKVIFKNIENRRWAIPKSFKLPQRIYVHTAKRDDDFDSSFKWLCNLLKGAYGFILMHYSKGIPRGALIGEVDVIDCVTKSDNPWFVGPYGFVLANLTVYKEPIPCRGKLGFFEPDIPEVMAQKDCSEK